MTEFDKIKLTPDEREWLAKACPYLKPSYLDFLSAYRFNPAQLHLSFVPIPEDAEKDARGDVKARGDIHIHAVGPWRETILWEVPLMACLSEIYFTTADKDWNYDGQEGAYGSCFKNSMRVTQLDVVEQAYEKAKTLLAAGCSFSEFGTRRRRSYHTQDLVMEAILRAQKDSPDAPAKVSGTSNVSHSSLTVLPDCHSTKAVWPIGASRDEV